MEANRSSSKSETGGDRVERATMSLLILLSLEDLAGKYEKISATDKQSSYRP